MGECLGGKNECRNEGILVSTYRLHIIMINDGKDDNSLK